MQAGAIALTVQISRHYLYCQHVITNTVHCVILPCQFVLLCDVEYKAVTGQFRESKATPKGGSARTLPGQSRLRLGRLR